MTARDRFNRIRWDEIRADSARWNASLPDIRPGDYVVICVNRQFDGVGQVVRVSCRDRLYLDDSGREPFTATTGRKQDWGEDGHGRFTTWYRVSRAKALRRVGEVVS